MLKQLLTAINFTSLFILFIYITTPSCKKDIITIKESDTIVVSDTVNVNDTIVVNDNLPDYILAGQTSGAGINYVDIINDTIYPPYVNSNITRYIDIDSDGTNDFYFNLYFFVSQGASHSYEGLISTSIANEVIGDVNNIIPLNTNDTIGIMNGFLNSTLLFDHLTVLVPGTSTETGFMEKRRV